MPVPEPLLTRMIIKHVAIFSPKSEHNLICHNVVVIQWPSEKERHENWGRLEILRSKNYNFFIDFVWVAPLIIRHLLDKKQVRVVIPSVYTVSVILSQICGSEIFFLVFLLENGSFVVVVQDHYWEKNVSFEVTSNEAKVCDYLFFTFWLCFIFSLISLFDILLNQTLSVIERYLVTELKVVSFLWIAQFLTTIIFWQ